VRRVGLHFAALTFLAPERVRLRYRLEGMDPVWTESIGVHDTSYTNCRRLVHVPGDDLERQRDLEREGAALAFTVLPHFWATWWFRAACALAFILTVPMYVLLRIRRLETRQRQMSSWWKNARGLSGRARSGSVPSSRRHRTPSSAMDTSGRIVEWNHRAEAIFGRSRAEALDFRWSTP